jgi:hypothetical protein
MNIPEEANLHPENHASEITRKSDIVSARTHAAIPTSTVSAFSYPRPIKEIKILQLKPRPRDFSSPLLAKD